MAKKQSKPRVVPLTGETTLNGPLAPPPPPSVVGQGRLASAIHAEPIRWFLPGFLPAGVLTLVVGEPRTGKSSMGAWMCSMADRPAIMPGQEEDVARLLLPRLHAHGANLHDVLILDDRQWSMPHDRQGLTDRLRAHACDLLWVDPIDSYCGETGENDGPGVRAALEALSRVARDTGALVAAARHPGKSAGNVCPGSRQWRAVPREIVELRRDPGPPERRILRLLRDPLNVAPSPRAYHLEGRTGTCPVFVLDSPIADQVADTIGQGDIVDRWMVDEAETLICALLADGEQTSVHIYQQAELHRLRERTVRVAMRRLGVVVRREGSGLEHRSYWSLPTDSGTPAV